MPNPANDAEYQVVALESNALYTGPNSLLFAQNEDAEKSYIIPLLSNALYVFAPLFITGTY